MKISIMNIWADFECRSYLLNSHSVIQISSSNQTLFTDSNRSWMLSQISIMQNLFLLACAFTIAWIIMTWVVLMQLYAFIYPSLLYEFIIEFPDHNERHCLLFFEFKKYIVQNEFYCGSIVANSLSDY